MRILFEEDSARSISDATDYADLLENDYFHPLRVQQHGRHLSSHNTLEYCVDSEEFDILNLHSYDVYDWFLFIFTVVFINGVCFSCGCIGYRLTFTSGSQAAAIIRQITTPHLVEMETPHQQELAVGDGMCSGFGCGSGCGHVHIIHSPDPHDEFRDCNEIDVDMDFEEVVTPSKGTNSVILKLPPVDMHCGMDLVFGMDSRRSGTRNSHSASMTSQRLPHRGRTSRSATSLHQQYTGRLSDLLVFTARGQTVRRLYSGGISGNESTVNEHTPRSSDSSRTHLTWIRTIRAGDSSRSVSDSPEMVHERGPAVSSPDNMTTSRMNTARRSRSNLSKLEPIDESFERFASSDSIEML